MAEMFDRQIDRWQLLADRVKMNSPVQKALVQATARRNEMAAEAAPPDEGAVPRGSDRATTARSQYEATSHLRRFLVHLDDT